MNTSPDQPAPVRTTCPYCGVGCGLTATAPADKDRTLQLQGDRHHPANFGRLCSKGSALVDTLSLDDRLLYPMVNGHRVHWYRALDAVADGFKTIIAEHGPDAVAFYVSGQLLTEDYYVANKLMKGFIGSANIDTNSRLCMSSSVAGHKRAFGSDTVPGNYEDLELADLIILTGSNLAWCHPVLYQRIVKAREMRPQMQVVVIDPRRTATCEIADLHLPLRPGTDTLLFNGLLGYLQQNDVIDSEFIAAHTENFEETLLSARRVAPDADSVAHGCGLNKEDVDRLFQLFARREKVVTVYSQGVNQSSYGSDKVNTIINCHLATGRIGRPGMGPFSVTGQPNAMGGREAGGLANMLAAHMDFTPADIDRVGRFWRAQRMATRPGLKAVELFQAVATGRIKAIWIMATNPVVSLPDADNVIAALQRCPLVVVSEVCRDSDTAKLADILLPALAWGEKDGSVTNSERRISRQRAFLPIPGEARPDWWIVAQMAQRMGYKKAFAYSHPAQIFCEHAALSGFENDGSRGFDIGALKNLSEAEYDELQPLQWPLPENQAQSGGTARLFGNGGFFTPSGRARLIAVGERAPANAPDEAYPLILNTGRVRDHWHTMTRTGKSARLSSHTPEPYAELHPADAIQHAIEEDTLLRISSRWGRVIVRARLSVAQQRGSVFVPMHWSAQFAAAGRIDAVVNPVTDPLSGQPEAKHTPVAIEPYRPRWHGFVIAARELSFNDTISYRVGIRGNSFWRYEIASDSVPADWAAWSSDLAALADAEWVEYSDSATVRYRSAAICDGRLQFCLFAGPDHELPSRAWLAQLFDEQLLQPGARLRLLSGQPGADQPDCGPIICSCFQVGLNTLCDAIEQQQLLSAEAIGAALKAGTNCGSCLPELRSLIERNKPVYSLSAAHCNGEISEHTH